jgi:nicotinate-nucleotide adenylyltransferase
MDTRSDRSPRLGIFGGTFDPIHLGHLIAATELRHALSLDRVLFVPAGRPPHKAAREVSSGADRLAMLRLAVADNPAVEIDTLDLERGGLSFTADLLAALLDQRPGSALFFLMGNDSLRDLPNWHEPRRIAELAELGVASRAGVGFDLDAVLRAVPEARNRVHLVPIPLIGISSTEIRRRVAAGAPVAYQVPRAVEEYIRNRGLYLPQPSEGR